MCWKQQGHLGEAAQLKVGVMEVRTRLPELEHPNILRSIPNLAYTWRVQDEAEEAIGFDIASSKPQTRALIIPDGIASAKILRQCVSTPRAKGGK